MAYISPKELIDASTDAHSLAKLINDPAGAPNVNRAGNDIGNVSSIMAQAIAATPLAVGMYGTTGAGVAATTSGQYFTVAVSASADALDVYLNSSGVAQLITQLPASEIAYRASALTAGYPLDKSNSFSNASGNMDLFNRLLRGVLDIRLFGLPKTDNYYFERLRRNVSGNWHIVIKRASDGATVLQYFAGLTEPADPDEPMLVKLPGIVAGASGTLMIRWSAFVAGQTNSGLTVAISSSCLDFMYPSQLNTQPAFSARMGNIVLTLDPAAFASVDESARVFSWPVLNVIAGEANAVARYRLSSGGVTFVGTTPQIAWLDLREAATYGTTNVPSSAVKVGTYTNGSTRTENDYVAEPHQFPLAWSSGVGRVDVNPFIRTDAPPPPSDVYTDVVVVKRDLANNVVSVYYRANARPGSSAYIHVRLLHWISEDADAWTIGGVWEVQRTGYESFTVGKELIVEGTELLAAFQEKDMPDFMGSRAHGDEVMVEAPTLLVDGAYISLITGPLAWYHGAQATLIEKTRMYRVGSVRGTPLIERGLMLTFRDLQIYADQRVKYLASFTLSNGYMAMLAPHRYDTYVAGVSEDAGSAQISGLYSHNGTFTPMDVSARQAAVDPAADYARPTPRVTHLKIWGTYGTEFELEVLEASDILKDIFFMQRNNYAYNKGYIGFIGGYSGDQVVSTGDEWICRTRISIKSNA